MTAYYGTNVTSVLYSGGSGSGFVADGYIRTVEKIWMETFNFSAVLTTADSVCIALIPGNKKITGVDVYLPFGFTPTTATINVGVATPAIAGVLTTYCSILISNATTYQVSVSTFGNLSLTNKVSMMPTSYNITGGVNFPFVTTTSTVASSGGAAVIQDTTRVYMFIGVTAMTAPTSGTFTSIVRYT